MDFTKKRWIVLAACCMINLCLGMTYSWSVFAGHLAEKLNVADLSIIYAIAVPWTPLAMIVGGYVNERIGPRKLYAILGVWYGLGIVASGLVASTGMLIISFSFGVGLGSCILYALIVNSSVKLFPDKRGLAGGIVTATFGLSSMIVSPIASNLILRRGITSAFIIIGVVFTIIISACVMLVQPVPSGYVPSGWTPPVSAANGIWVDKDWKQMIRTRSFYIMLFLFASGTFSGMMLISQASAMAQRVPLMRIEMAAMMVSALALSNTAGRLVCGALSDRIGRINALTVGLFSTLGGILMLMLCGPGDYLLFGLGTSLVGFGFGAFLGVFPGFCSDRFGLKYHSTNYGVLFTGYSVVGVVGPSIAGRMYHATESYDRALAVAALFSGFGLLLTLVYRVANGHKKVGH